MKHNHPNIAIGTLCKLFGKVRYAYYDHQYRLRDHELKDDILLQLVHHTRILMPRIGTRKLYHLLKPQLTEHRLNVGRDYLFELLSKHKLLIRTRKRKVLTTNSNHWMGKYSNLIKQLQPHMPGQLWVSDITYIRLINGFAYLSLITDAYSHKIVGYNFRKDLSAEGCLAALKMALLNKVSSHRQLIHHSDRGSQYCCKGYVDLLTENNIAISMTDNGDPYENAIAERVNGILKTEFNLYSSHVSFDETCNRIEKSIATYNQSRPHASCDYLTPQQAHNASGILKKRWKNYYKNAFINP